MVNVRHKYEKEAWQSYLSMFALLVLRFRFPCWGHQAYSPVWIIQLRSRETLHVTPSLTWAVPGSSQWKCNLWHWLNVTDCCVKSHQGCVSAHQIVKLHYVSLIRDALVISSMFEGIVLLYSFFFSRPFLISKMSVLILICTYLYCIIFLYIIYKIIW